MPCCQDRFEEACPIIREPSNPDDAGNVANFAAEIKNLKGRISAPLDQDFIVFIGICIIVLFSFLVLVFSTKC